jgi:uncharacterized protein (DUF1330 family)
MKTKYVIAAGMVGSFVFGAVAVQTLHAQAARKGYIITATDVTGNPDVYKRDYIDLLAPTYAPFGGRYIVRQAKPVAFEGEAPRGYVVITEFDTVDKARGWLNSPEFLKIKPVRDRETKSQVYLVEGVPN